MDEQRAEFEAWAKPIGYKVKWSEADAMFIAGYENAPAHHAYEGWQAATQRQQERIAELEAQVQALSRDAGRYRFIRDNCNRRINIEIDNAGMEISDTVDASIDAAIAAGKGGGMTTESDRELLELAARAHGGLERVGTFGWIHVDSNGQRCAWWEPLTDDGDALRLAVRLRLHVSVFADSIGIGTPARGYEESKWTDDPYAATRRAIVRAAAEIARATHKEGA